jgi:hypothetical protein
MKYSQLILISALMASSGTKAHRLAVRDEVDELLEK